jgi:hypothetical protein
MSNTASSGSGLSTRQKLLLSAGVVAGAAAIMGTGTYALFTGTTNTQSTLSSGTVVLLDVSANAANNRLSVGAANLAAGDSVQRAVNIKNTGTIDMAAVTLTTSAPVTSSLLDTDTSNGLQMVISQCSVPWTESGGPAYTYTCGGSTTSVVASRPVVGSNLALSGLTLTPNTSNYLRVTLTLPSAAPDTLQNQSSVINFAFTGTQRTSTSQ